MKLRTILWIALRAIVGISSVWVTLRGFKGIYGLDFRQDTLVSIFYCLFPTLSFFVFLFVKPPKLEAGLHTLIAMGYLTTFSMLNWRTCAELGYCGTAASTVIETFRSKPVLAAFAVVVFSLAALVCDVRTKTKTSVMTRGK